MLAKVQDTWHRDTDLLLTEAVAIARASAFASSPSGPVCFGGMKRVRWCLNIQCAALRGGNIKCRTFEYFIRHCKLAWTLHKEALSLLHWTVSRFALCFRRKYSVSKIVSKPDFYSSGRYDLHSKDICYTNLWKGRFVRAKGSIACKMWSNARDPWTMVSNITLQTFSPNGN